jgi:hypothetical protein
LSRFQPIDRPWKDGPAPRLGGPAVDVLASVSGPEPQRTRFEGILRKALGSMSGTRVLVRGLPGNPGGAPSALPLKSGDLNIFDHLDGSAMEALFRTATMVVARSGYTTVMEMAGLGLTQVVMVPTPGQSEQEYLAEHLDEARIAQRMDQEELDLPEAQRRAGRYVGFGAVARGPSAQDLPSLADFIAGHPLFRGSSR